MSDKPMRLAIMGTRGIPANYGGFETFAEELSARLVARGHQVTVYGRSHYVDRRLREHRGARLVVLPSLRAKYLDTVVHAALSVVHGAFRRYDAVLMCNSANAFACWLPRLVGQKVLINVDGLEWQRGKWNRLGRWWYLLGERLSGLFASRVVSDAEVIRKYYRRRYKVESLCIPYGAPEGKAPGRAALERLGLAPDGYLLYVSRLEPENNAHVVIEAYGKLGPSMPLVIVGDAPYAAAYIARLKAMAGPGVIFAGAVYGEGYRELQSNCFAYVQATEVGGTHPALIEGMGMANAVVANDTPENREAAGDGAFFYRRNDPEALAGVLGRLLADPAIRGPLREKALSIVRSRYSWERIADRYEEAFRAILGRGRAEPAAP